MQSRAMNRQQSRTSDRLRAGAAYADPSVKVETAYTNTFDDVQAGKQCAQSLAAKHADIIFQAAGRSGNGVFAAAKAGGFYAIGVDQDQKLSAKEYDDVIICSVVKKVGDSIYDVIKDLYRRGCLGGRTHLESRYGNGLYRYGLRRCTVGAADQ